jgi:zinc protease
MVMKLRAERIEGIEQIDIQNYYNSQLSPENCTILVSGRITDKIEKEIETFFESLVWNKMNTPKSETIAINTSAEKQFYLEKKGAVQASLNIGKILFNMNEPDYPEFLLTNTIFGGYFGSRLMSKIREEKGYTYGIHSSLQTLKHSGIFCIQTEIGVEHKKNCLEDIYNEIDKMNTDLVSDREIVLARNYLLGKFLSRIDGPTKSSRTI